MVKAIVTDVEGTTSSISFVKEVLFPYAAQALPGFLTQHWAAPEVVAQITTLREQTGDALATAEAANELLQRWITEDRKATPLKALQGMIWRHGYEHGVYKAHLYPEVAARLRDWRSQGIRLYVYSSGSIEAQKLFFRHSEGGDLSPLLDGYFDTTSGPKQESDSYRRITEAIELPPEDILFLSDVVAELDAARTAGLHTVLLDRDGLAPAAGHPRVHDFDEIQLPA